MREFLGSPVWQFLGVVFAFLAIILTVALYLKQRQRKALSFRVLSDTTLLSVEDDIKGRVKIFFDDQQIDEVSLFILEIVNSGNASISKDDYEQPVTLNLNEGAIILSSEVVKTVPKHLPVTIHVEDERLLLDPLLLNSGDAVSVKILISGGKSYRVYGRIQGVKTIAEMVPMRYSLSFKLSLGYLVLGSFSVITTFGLWVMIPVSPWSDNILMFMYLALLLIGLFSITIGLWALMPRIKIKTGDISKNS